MLSIFEQHSRKVTKSYFDHKSIASIQLDSYNNMITFGLQSVFENIGVVNIQLSKTERVELEFGNIFVSEPVFHQGRTIEKLFPSVARMRNITYESTIYVDVNVCKFKDDVKVENTTFTRISLCKIPTMVGSVGCNLYKYTIDQKIAAGECRFDPGGYFIIKGIERVIVTLQRPNYNFVQVIEQSQTSSSKYVFIAEIRSVAEESGYSVLVQSMINSKGEIFISLPNIKEQIPVGIVFKAMGISCEDIPKMFNIDNLKIVKSILHSSAHITTKQDAIMYISRHLMYVIQKDMQYKYAQQIIEMELFPHLGITATLREKAVFLGYMISKLVSTFVGNRNPDDRDNVSNKRFDTTGVLVLELVKNAMQVFIKNMQKTVNVTSFQRKFDILSIIDANKDSISKSIRTCFSTGNWGIKNPNNTRVGVSQVMSRLTFASMLSHIRHITIPIGRESKNTKIRQIHTSQFGFICPAETPEGQTSGLVTNYALLTRVSTRIPSVIVKDIVFDSNFLAPNGPCVIFVNGCAISNTDSPELFVKEFIKKRVDGLVYQDISIIYNNIDNEIRIQCDEGRLMRPLIKMVDGQLPPEWYSTSDWQELIDRGVIQYVDSLEIEYSYIAMSPSDVEISDDPYDFCEIDPASMLGVCASMIPFPDHSQSPRNCYQASMGKQALGVPMETFNLRAGTSLYVMDYPQRPLVTTHFSNILHLNEMPSGCNVVIAIMPKEGFNQEDSICINRSSIERGLFSVMSYFTIQDEEERASSSEFQTIEIPSPEIQIQKNNYSFLDKHGVIKIGTRVKKDDVIIGKVLTKTSKENQNEKRDISITIKVGEEGVIDNVRILSTERGWKLVKVTIREAKIPEPGDKFASRAAQKGTCGMVFSQENMPFTKDGITPDIIINPHCMPSRMTINQLLETVLGKACSIKGTFGDATPFSSNSVDIMNKLNDDLEKDGFCQEEMYNPYTGEKFDTKIFVGIAYYQRLKHIVSEKMHSRAKGHVTMLCRQPLEGRSRDGGLRFGEMERDAMICHGNSAFLKDRLFYMSDPYSVSVCGKCGLMSQNDCKKCKNDKLITVNIPYAAKLLFQELAAMCIKTELIPIMQK